MAYIYDLTDTWNASGTTFNGIKLNVTNTASAAASKLVTLQIGGTEHFSVTKAGVGYFSGNLGIGNTSPNALLELSKASGAADLRLSVNGTLYANIYASASDTNIFGVQNLPLIFGTNNTERMRITGGGNVGIGTSSPGAKFQVIGSTTVGGYANVAAAFGAGVSSELYLGSLNGNNPYIGSGGAFPLSFNTNGTERMRIDSSGNVGIGTSAPTSRLTITGGTTEIRDGNYLMLRPSGNGWDMRLQATSTQLDILSGGAPGSPIMSLVNGGNVGIGTSSPTTKLQIGDISAADATYQGRIKLEDTSASLQTIGGLEFATSAFGAGYGWKINSIDSSGVHLAFGTRQNSATWSEAMRIGSSGNLLVGSTSTSYAYANTSMRWLGTGGGVLLSQNTTANTNQMVFFNPNGAVGSINTDGTGTIFATSSDARLKYDIVDAPEASGLIDAIKVRSFKWNADNSEQRYGFIAQELLPIAPEAVTVPEEEDKMMGVDYSKLVPMLIKEVQSLRARVAQLEGN